MPDLYRYTDDELYNIMADLVSVEKAKSITYEAQMYLLGEIIEIRKELMARKKSRAKTCERLSALKYRRWDYEGDSGDAA